MAIERLLTGSIKDQIKDLMSTEDLVIEAFRDLVKDAHAAWARRTDFTPESALSIYIDHTCGPTAKARANSCCAERMVPQTENVQEWHADVL